MLLDELIKNKREFEIQNTLSIDDFLVGTKSNSILNVHPKKIQYFFVNQNFTFIY